MLLSRAISLLIAAPFIFGCVGPSVHDGDKHYLPVQAAGFYLRHLPSVPMEPSLYQCLTLPTRQGVPFPRFATSLSSLRPPGAKGNRSGRVTIVDRIDVSSSRTIIYALFQWPSLPEKFLLIRVDCRLEGNQWRIELPRSVGKFRPIDVIHEGGELSDEVYLEVGEIIRGERESIDAGLQRRKVEEELRADSRAREGSLTALVTMGKKCYNEGRYRKAMMAFGKALKLDAENDLAREYMARCREALKGD